MKIAFVFTFVLLLSVGIHAGFAPPVLTGRLVFTGGTEKGRGIIGVDLHPLKVSLIFPNSSSCVFFTPNQCFSGGLLTVRETINTGSCDLIKYDLHCNATVLAGGFPGRVALPCAIDRDTILLSHKKSEGRFEVLSLTNNQLRSTPIETSHFVRFSLVRSVKPAIIVFCVQGRAYASDLQLHTIRDLCASQEASVGAYSNRLYLQLSPREIGVATLEGVIGNRFRSQWPVLSIASSPDGRYVALLCAKTLNNLTAGYNIAVYTYEGTRVLDVADTFIEAHADLTWIDCAKM